MNTLTLDSWALEILAELLASPEPDTLRSVERLPDATERAILDGLAKGDPDAIAQLYREYGDEVRRLVILPRIRRREAVLDVLHETFIRAARKGRDFRWKGVGFFPWLRAIALGELRNHARAEGRAVALHVPLEDALPWLAGPDEVLGRIEVKERAAATRARLAAALEGLSERDQEALRLRLIERRSSREAADVLGVKPSHLDVIFFRALRRLRAALNESDAETRNGHG